MKPLTSADPNSAKPMPVISADPMPVRTESLSARPDSSGISVPARAETDAHPKTDAPAKPARFGGPKIKPAPAVPHPDDPLSLRRLSDDYMNHLRHERGCAKTTLIGYRCWLNIFNGWLDANGHPGADLSAFTTVNLRSYQYAMSQDKKRPRTILSAFNPIKGLGEFLVTHGLLTVNPTKALTMPKKDAAQRLTVSSAEITALMTALERLPSPRRVDLARAIISTFVFTGVRFQELLDIRVQDVSLAGRTLLVASGKGSKSRLLYPPPPCMEAIAQWLKRREPECGHDWLFAYDLSRRIGEEGVRQLLEDIKAIAGLRGAANIKPHSLRHAFATRMMKNGAPLKAIQQALGHSVCSTTFQYLHLDEEQTKHMAAYAALDAAPPAHAAPSPEPPRQRPDQAGFTRMRRSIPGTQR